MLGGVKSRRFGGEHTSACIPKKKSDNVMVAGDVPDLPPAEGSSNVRARANKFLARLDKAKQNKLRNSSARPRHRMRRGHTGIHYTKEGKMTSNDGRSWTVRDKLSQYRKDIEEDEKLAEALEQEDADLVETSFEKSIQLDNMQDDYRTMSGNVQKLYHDIQFEKEKKLKLASELKALRHEVDATRGLAVIEKERYHQKLLEVKAAEAQLKQQFIEDQKEYETKERTMDAEIDSLTEQLEHAREMAVEIERLKEDGKLRTHDIEKMKESLEQAKACTLHEAVNAAAIAAKEEAEKLHNIIAHLQKELTVTTKMTDQLEAEQNILKEELAVAENRNSVLAASLSPDGSSEVSPLAIFARKIASDAVDETRAVDTLKQSVADLTAQVDKEKATADGLEKRIQVEREAHEAAQKVLKEKLGKDLQALRTYIDMLTHKVNELSENPGARR